MFLSLLLFLTGPSLLSLLFITCWVGMKIPMNLHLLRWEARWLSNQGGGATASERTNSPFSKKKSAFPNPFLPLFSFLNSNSSNTNPKLLDLKKKIQNITSLTSLIRFGLCNLSAGFTLLCACKGRVRRFEAGLVLWHGSVMYVWCVRACVRLLAWWFGLITAVMVLWCYAICFCVAIPCIVCVHLVCVSGTTSSAFVRVSVVRGCCEAVNGCCWTTAVSRVRGFDVVVAGSVVLIVQLETCV